MRFLALLLVLAMPAKATESVPPVELEAMLADAVTLSAYLAGDAALSPDAVASIRAEEAADIARDPAGQRRVYADVRSLLERARAADPVSRVQLRERTLMTLYFASMSEPQAGSTVILDTSLAHNPVVAADDGLKWLVTRRGLEALLRANALVSELASHAPPSVELQALEAEVRRTFAGMSRAEREILAFAESRATALRQHVDSLDQTGREELVAWVRKEAPTADKVPFAARSLETHALLAPMKANIDQANAAMNRVIGLTGLLGVLESPGGRP